jgi:hypothetical protein
MMYRVGTLPYSYSVRADASLVNGSTVYSNFWGFEVTRIRKRRNNVQNQAIILYMKT